MNKYNKDKTELEFETGKDDLKEEKYLNLANNFNQTKDEDSQYKEPTFENDPKLIDWSQANLHEPRVLTIKNVRDIFFALLNQSQCQ